MYSVILASYSLNAADRQLFPLLLHDVRETFHFSLADAGLLSTIFTLGLAIAGVPTGFLLSRLPRKTVLILGISIFSVATAAMVLARGFSSMLLLLFSTGIGEAMQLTVIIAIAASYFGTNRAAAIGAGNFCFGMGAFFGPVLASTWLGHFGTWKAPMLIFGLLGFMAIAAIAICVRPWLSEARIAEHHVADLQGAATLFNANTVILTSLSVIGGFVLYGFTGMYPTFLRESLHYPPKSAAVVAGLYGAGALVSIAGGWVGDRISPRILLSSAFLLIALLGYLCFRPGGSFLTHAVLTCIFGAVGSGTIYVNLAGFHVKAVRRTLAGRASGMFVTSFYSAGAVAGFLMGKIAAHAGWSKAGLLQITVFSLIGSALALALRPAKMCL